MHRLSLLVLISLVVRASFAPAQVVATRDTMVDVGGYKLHARLTGTSQVGKPTVVFELGFGSTLATWIDLPAAIAKSAPVIAYERAGVGTSQPGKSVPTVEQSAKDLHQLLAALGVSGPVILVGHSWGGPIIHTFGAMFPRDVGGLVYVDPVDFTQTEADMQSVWVKAGVKNGHDILGSVAKKLRPGATAGVVAEAREIARVDAGGFADLRKDGDAPDVPTVVLLAGKREPDPSFPGDQRIYGEARLAQRLDHFGNLVQRLTNGTMVLASASGHFIHLTEPLLVQQAVERVVTAATPHPELEPFVGNYRLTKDLAIRIARAGATLTLQLTGQQPLPMQGVSARTFAIPSVGATIEFDVDSSGATTALVLVQNGTRNRAPREK